LDVVEIDATAGACLKPEITTVWVRKVEKNPKFLFTAKLHTSFTCDRILDPEHIRSWKAGLVPLQRAKRLGCVLMQFSQSFRYTAENRAFFVQLRRLFHEFPLAAEMRHESWMLDEALGTFIDYNVAFCNLDQPSRARAMPPTSFLTSKIGYVRLCGRAAGATYGYSPSLLDEWRARVERVAVYSENTFVVFANEAGGKAFWNAGQFKRGYLEDHASPTKRTRRDVPRHGMSQASLFPDLPNKAIA
jgi:uncharacterized protein YecE (DUF72 family)